MGVFTTKNSNAEPLGVNKNFTYYFKRIGVSVLFSGAAVGVSHVVQATRAGADFSLALLPVIALCLFLKYPACLFGPLYTKVTGESLIAGYKRIGKWTIPLVGVSFVCIMATVVAAVSMLAAGILISTLNLGYDITVLALILGLASTCISLFSSFKIFQDAMKYIFILLTLLSILALLIALPSTSLETFSIKFSFESFTKDNIFFIAALIGWMPAGLDLPMMHSQWLLSRNFVEPKKDNAIEDFNFGYLSTSFLAVLFVILGAVLFFNSGTIATSSAGGFSKQLLNAYSNHLGSFGGLVIGLTLFLAIFSSLIVVIDGFPRVLSEVISVGFHSKNAQKEKTTFYRSMSSWIQFFGAAIILLAFSGSFTTLVDFATTSSFLLGPIFAYLNHKVINLPEFSKHKIVSDYFRFWSLAGVTFFTLFAVYFVFLKFF